MKMNSFLGVSLALASLAAGCSTTGSDRPSAPPPSAKAYPIIGYLSGRDNLITIKSGPHGPLYSVTTKDGRVLYEDLTPEQLQAQAPEIHRAVGSGTAGGNDPIPLRVLDHDVINRKLERPLP